jgi:predicted nucleic acid-binding protein
LGLSPIRAFLKRHRRIALDTSVFIYYLEENPSYADTAGEVFKWLESSPHSAVTSSITMTELLVRPYRAANLPLVNRYFGLLSTFPHLEWIPPDLAIADMAAQLRARHNLRTPDALQVATALRSGATALLTNDADLKRIPRIEVALFDHFVASGA